ncbi:MAG: hypothetical protein K9J17_16430 [Flavobacteriales bacterium]|nr:hypothetical protein [Flavobacteriales bacterium]
MSLLIVCFVLTNGNSQPVKVDFSGVYHRISGIPGERGKLIVHPDSTFEVIDDLYLFRGGSCARFSPYLPELGARIYMNPDSGKHNGGSFHVTYDSFDTIYVFQLPDSYLAKDYALKNPHTYPLNSFSYEKVPSDNRIKRKN